MIDAEETYKIASLRESDTMKASGWRMMDRLYVSLRESDTINCRATK